MAYFCMEFGLDARLHTYAGGLGILAGDCLKTAPELDIPMVGIGILWRQGYGSQSIAAGGQLQVWFPNRTDDFLENLDLKVLVETKSRPVAVQVWRVSCFGNAPLYLLDTDLPENHPADRSITARLYGGDREARVAQEMVLGIGGVRALRHLGLPVAVYHFNEGHAVLGAVELIREQSAAGVPFPAAWAAVRERVVFTTHTPVAAGNETHDHDLLQAMGAYNGLGYAEMAALGGDPFGMTVAGLRLARRANAVSAAHGDTACSMWAGVAGTAPLMHITNGVHLGTWQSQPLRAARERGYDLWSAHQAEKRELRQAVAARTGTDFDPEVLTIGFARRAVAYKRHDLILRHSERIEPLLHGRALQLLWSGKAHPADAEGAAMLARLLDWARRFPGQVAFLPDYDMELGRLLTRGCDVWLNNPVPPMEASGTSGMKAALNGVLNCSVLDGWWAEACDHGSNGWQFGDGYTGPDQDEHDAGALHHVLTAEVIPTYYNNRPRWTRMMQASMAMAEERFSSRRMLAEYRDRLYL